MNQLVCIKNNCVVTDSLTVAEVFEKEHKHVVRDIEVQISKLHEAKEHEFVKSNFGLEIFKAKNNKEAKKYLLTEEAFTLVAMSYTTPEAMKMKVRFIEEFKRMRAELEKQKQPFKLPTTYKEALLQLVEQVGQNEKLQTENLVLVQQNKELKPKASYYDMVLQNKSLLSVSKIAKDYGMSAIALNKKLRELGVQYKQGDIWLLYAKYQDKGYTQTTTHVIDADKSKVSTKWTQKGRLFIYDLLKKEGILPMIERDDHDLTGTEV